MRSARAPLHSCETSTRWPSSRRKRAQRDAVLRLPLRERAGAGVTREILKAESRAKLWLDYNKSTSRMSSSLLPACGARERSGALRQMLTQARERTLCLVSDLTGEQLL